MTRRTAVAAPNQAAADAAVEVGQAGGGAVDAAIAACLVTCVNEPGVVSPGGGAFVTVAVPGQEPVTVDGSVAMPGLGAPKELFGTGAREVTTAYGGGVTMTIGHGSVAVPGALAAFGEAHRRFGTASWADVVAPAVRVAREGFLLGEAAASYLAIVHDDVFGWDPQSRRAVHASDGVTPLGVGERMVVDELADTLQRIADVGAQDLYTGDLAAAVLDDMGCHGGLLGARDLAEYRVRVRPALAVDAGRWRMRTNPPPAIGGPVLAAMLLLLDEPAGEGAEAVRALVEVQRAVLRHRADHLDVSEDRLDAVTALLDGLRAQGLTWLRGSPSTVHVSVVDHDGAACAVTSSSGYGSGVMVPGTGLWLNNCLGEPELNRRGLHGWTPGARLPSNMAPTVGRRDDGALLAIGSPGADRITTAVAQVLLGMARGDDLETAVSAPRVHVSRLPGGEVVDHEDDLVLPPLDLPTRAWPRHSMFFGGVTAAMRDADGRLHLGADPRRGGGTAIG